MPKGKNNVSDFIPVARIADMLNKPNTSYEFNGEERIYPDIKLIYWCGGNPFHHHQDLNTLHQAWKNPDTVIVNEPWWTATAQRADIVSLQQHLMKGKILVRQMVVITIFLYAKAY